MLLINQTENGILIGFQQYDKLFVNYSENVKHAIQSIACMNVKKIGRAGYSEYLEIKRHVENERDFI